MHTFSKKENLKKISKFCYHEEMLATLPTAAPRSVVRSARGDATAAFCLQRLLQLAARIISATASRRNAASEHPDSAAQCAVLLPFLIHVRLLLYLSQRRQSGSGSVTSPRARAATSANDEFQQQHNNSAS